MGRPTIKTPEICAAICELVAQGKSQRQIADIEGMPTKETIRAWLVSDPEFSAQNARAKQIAAEHMAEEIMEISDDGRNDVFVDADGNEHVDNDVIQRSKLRVDTRKWLLAKLLPKKYGEKIEHEVNGDHVVKIKIGGYDERT